MYLENYNNTKFTKIKMYVQPIISLDQVLLCTISIA